MHAALKDPAFLTFYYYWRRDNRPFLSQMKESTSYTNHFSEKQLEQKIRKVEKEMLDAARNLEFERAASLRDELKALRDRMMAVAGA